MLLYVFFTMTVMSVHLAESKDLTHLRCIHLAIGHLLSILHGQLTSAHYCKCLAHNWQPINIDINSCW